MPFEWSLPSKLGTTEIEPGDSAFIAPIFSLAAVLVEIQLQSNIMATETITTSANGLATPTSDSASQVRVQLSTPHPDISLPENPGPILVNTSNVILELFNSVLTDDLARPPAICPFHAC